jgi:hypothetical protein
MAFDSKVLRADSFQHPNFKVIIDLMQFKRTSLTKTCLWTLNNFMFYDKALIV